MILTRSNGAVIDLDTMPEAPPARKIVVNDFCPLASALPNFRFQEIQKREKMSILLLLLLLLLIAFFFFWLGGGGRDGINK